MSKHSIWSSKPKAYRPRIDSCRRYDGAPKFLFRSHQSALLEASRIGGRATTYWCAEHDGWHVGKTPKQTGGLDRHPDLLVELGTRACVQLLTADRYAHPAAMVGVLDRIHRNRGSAQVG